MKKERVLVDGEIGATSTFIKGGERIELKEGTGKPIHKPLVLDLKVLYEDDYLAVVHKPAGILVSGNSFKTIANALAQNLKMSNEPDAVTPRPIHRLDYPTTGLLLIGKTSTAIIALNQLFEKKLIVKTYTAVTIGKMEPMGKINLPIDDKPSVSEYERLQSIVSERFGFLNLVKLYPKTGRRHQLRKHLASISNPILGDSPYGIPRLVLKGKGLYLHANSLELVHPVTTKRLFIEKPPPKKFKKLFPVI